MLVVQRVRQASVYVDTRLVGQIGHGLLAYVAVTKQDLDAAGQLVLAPIKALAQKMTAMRLFAEAGQDASHFARSVKDVGGSVLAISQFTLPGRTSKGTRPSFDKAAPAEQAREGYEYFVEAVRACDVAVQTGEFAAYMEVQSVADGPITMLMANKDTPAPWA